MKGSGISIIITAYNTEKYIEECLDSIVRQSWFIDNNEWEILVGIDHCEKTLKKMKSIMGNYKNLRVFYMAENVGTYITSNTLISKTKYARVLRFDSDDVMKDCMVEQMMNAMSLVKNCKLVQCYYENMPKKEGKRNTNWAHGVFMCKKQLFADYGGFMPWRCAGDTEFLKRVGNKEKDSFIIFPQVLFYYRIHEESLTQKKETDMKSELRKQYREYIDTQSYENPVIETVMAPAVEILPKQKTKPKNDKVKEEPVKQMEEEPVKQVEEKQIKKPDESMLTLVPTVPQVIEENIPQAIEEKPVVQPPKYVKRILPKVTRRICTGKYLGV